MSKKDIILYSMGIAIFLFVSILIIRTQNNLQRDIVNTSRIENTNAQLEQTKLRYEYSSKVLLSNATRKNLAFLISSMMIVLGTVLIISKIESSINANLDTFEKVKFHITTTSPGVFVVLLGTIIILTTIVKSDSYKFKDSPIKTEIEIDAHSKPQDLNSKLDTVDLKSIIKLN